MSESDKELSLNEKGIDRKSFLKKTGLIVGGASLTAMLPSCSGYNSNQEVLYGNTYDFSYWESLLFRCYQGLVNRDSSKIYLNRYEKQIFLDWYKNYDHFKFEKFNDPYNLLAEYGSDYADGYVIIDPEAPDSINIAANYASIEDLLPVTEQLLDTQQLPELDIVYDLRNTFKGLNFKKMNRLETYQWVYENQWPHAGRNLVSIVSGAFYKDGELQTNFYTTNSSRDYAVAERALFFDLSSNPEHQKEYALKDKILSEMEPHSIVWGWHVDRDGEHQHIRQLSEHGLIAVGGANVAPNFSFHSRVKIDDGVKNFKKYNKNVNVNHQIEDKIYLTFAMSDGDSINHLLRNAHGAQWLSEDRGEIPFGWEMQLKLADIGPGILDYFQATATENDYFTASASGIGYTFPSAMDKSKLQTHLRKSKGYFQQTGLKSLVVLNSYDPVSSEKRRLYYDELSDEINGIMQGYTRGPETEELYGILRKGDKDQFPEYMTWLSTSLPINHGDPIDKMEKNLNMLAKRRKQRPLFVPIHIPRSYFKYSELVELMERLDNNFEAINPSSFNAKFANARSNKVILNPPEFIVPTTTDIKNERKNVLSATLKNFSDKESKINFRAELNTNNWDNPIRTTKEISLGAKENKEAKLVFDLSDRKGMGEGEIKYFIDNKLFVESPVKFVNKK